MIVGPNKGVENALKKIGDEDPAILLDWNIASLNAAVAHVNATQPTLPNWSTQLQYPMTPEGLQEDIAASLALPGGGANRPELVETILWRFWQNQFHDERSVCDCPVHT